VLTSSKPDGELRKALRASPTAPELLEYVVSCALDPCERVDLPDEALAAPGDEALATWRRRFPDGLPGQLGLCSASYRANAGANGPADVSWALRDSRPT